MLELTCSWLSDCVTSGKARHQLLAETRLSRKTGRFAAQVKKLVGQSSRPVEFWELSLAPLYLHCTKCLYSVKFLRKT